MNIRRFFAVIAMASACAFAALPSTMLFQGSMTIDGKAQTGSTELVVALYDAPTAGTKVWEETFAGVAMVNGAFAVQLGAVTKLPTFDKPLHVQLTAGGKAAETRVPLTLAPYAAMAGAIPNVRSEGSYLHLDAPIVELGDSGIIRARNVSGTNKRQTLVKMITNNNESWLEMHAEDKLDSTRRSSVNLTERSAVISSQQLGGMEGGTKTSWMEITKDKILLASDSIVLYQDSSIIVTPALRLKPGRYVGGPYSTIPVCDAKTAGTIIYDCGYAGSATSFKGCVYMGLGVGNRYEWKILSN